ncbi:MAG: hypothetical protein AB7F43_10045 [Bacteriovoracia bacterium]
MRFAILLSLFIGVVGFGASSDLLKDNSSKPEIVVTDGPGGTGQPDSDSDDKGKRGKLGPITSGEILRELEKLNSELSTLELKLSLGIKQKHEGSILYSITNAMQISTGVVSALATLEFARSLFVLGYRAYNKESNWKPYLLHSSVAGVASLAAYGMHILSDKIHNADDGVVALSEEERYQLQQAVDELKGEMNILKDFLESARRFEAKNK